VHLTDMRPRYFESRFGLRFEEILTEAHAGRQQRSACHCRCYKEAWVRWHTHKCRIRAPAHVLVGGYVFVGLVASAVTHEGTPVHASAK
jgi:hypothetical protein